MQEPGLKPQYQLYTAYVADQVEKIVRRSDLKVIASEAKQSYS